MSGQDLDARWCTTVAAALMCALATSSQAADTIPTGADPSPLFGALPFSQEMPLFEDFGTKPIADCIRCASRVSGAQQTA